MGLIFPKTSAVVGPASRGLINPLTDLTFLGSFKLPESGDPAAHSCSTFAWGACNFQFPGAIGFSPAGNSGAGSLFIAGAGGGAGGCGQSSVPKVAEVSIPTPVISSSVGSLNAASYLQGTPFGDITGGLGVGNDITQQAGGTAQGVWLGNMFFQGGTCYWTVYVGYDNGPTVASHGYSTNPANLQSPGAHGLYTLNDSAGALVRATAGYVAEIPNDANGNWQSVFGGNTHFSGLSGPSIESNEGNGPGMTCFKAADFIGQSNGFAASAKSYLYYPNSNPCTLWDEVGFTTQLAGGVFISSVSRYGLLYWGEQATNIAWYGYPSYYGWRNDGASSFPANQDNPPIHQGFSQYATFGSVTGWPINDVGAGPAPAHRYWWDMLTNAETGEIGNKGTQQDSCQGAWWVYDPIVVASHIAGGGHTYDLTPPQIRFDSSNTTNPWLINTRYQSLGVAYDRAHNKIYMLQGFVYNPDTFNPYPLVHVYQHL